MKHAVFFDIDGTLWDEHMQVPQSTAEAIRELRIRGDYAFLCSGRSRAAIRSEKLLNEIGFDGIIAGCGTYIEYQGDVIFEKLIAAEELKRTLGILEKYHIPAILEGSEYLYADRAAFGNDPYIDYLSSMLGGGFKTAKEGLSCGRVNKLSADYTRGDVEGMKRELSGEYEMVFHEKRIVELLPKGYSKASGIQRICEHLEIAHQNTYAFGDSANDIEMLRYVQHGIAMGNGTDDAKEAADYVTVDIREDGIQAGLKYFGLIG